jgi:hypothetical protein
MTAICGKMFGWRDKKLRVLRAITSSCMYVTIIDLIALRTGSFTRVLVETMTGRETPLVCERDETAMFIAKVSQNVESVTSGRDELIWLLGCG